MDNNRLFVYGILKRGFDLDLTKRGWKFLGEAQLPGANLHGMGFKDATGTWTGVGLRFVEDPQRVVHGELFEVPDARWHWLDRIEQNGFCYTRKIVLVCREIDRAGAVEAEYENAWVYEHTYPGCKYDKSNLIEGGKF